MSDDSEEPESKVGEPKRPKMKAEDNPWYLLATLYGEPEEWVFVNDPNPQNEELRSKYRVAWNRYFSASLDEKTHAQLIERHAPEELNPLSPEEQQEVEKSFAVRRGSKVSISLPPVNSRIDFSGVQFDRNVYFDKYIFSNSLFREATFSGYIQFNGATFYRSADFQKAIFSGLASFHGVTFSYGAFFTGATFSHWAHFNSATFANTASFHGVTFSDYASFANAAFFFGVDFEDAVFTGGAWFHSTTFKWTSRFVNAVMNGETSFEDAKFRVRPPEFFGAKLHEGTVWRGIKPWPTPKRADEAGSFVDAYERLKLEMDRLKKHEDELDFFAFELQSKRVLLGPWRGLPIALYGVVSDYGRSYAWPFLWLLAVAVSGALLLLFSDALPVENSFGLSAANTLNVFGFRKDFIDPSDIKRLPAWLDVVSAVQTIAGTILLFLVGLGIRNKLRMK